MLVDIRRYPGSRRYPYFNKEALEISLPQNNIRYQHLIEFSGRRKVTVDSKNTIWRHGAFWWMLADQISQQVQLGIIPAAQAAH